MSYLDLIFNLALLVALSTISGFLENRWSRHTAPGVLLQGVLFGGAAVLGMLRPLNLGPGLIFDGRSIMVGLCALFFGPWAAAVAGALTIACRVWLGGVGMLTGLLVILSSTGIGLLAHFRLKPEVKPPSVQGLYLFGLAVHVAMLALMFTLPGGIGPAIVMRIGLPVILLYPLVTILVGKMLTDQIWAERATATLQEREERYGRLFNSSNDAVFVHPLGEGKSGKFVEVNDIACSRLGYSRKELLNLSVCDIEAGEMDEVTGEVLETLAMDGKAMFETVLVGRLGEKFPVEISSRVFESAGGSYVLSVVRDISERKLAEDALRESEAFLITLLDAIPIPVFYKDRDGRYLGFNRAFERFLGMTKERLVGKTVFGIYPLEYAQILHAQDADLFDKGDARQCECKIKVGDGLAHDVILNKAVFTDGQGAVSGLIGTILDITKRKRSEEMLRQAEQNFRSSLEESPLGVRIVTNEGETIYANRAILDIYGCDSIEDLKATQAAESFISKSYSEFHANKEEEREDDYNEPEYEISIVRKDGEVRHLHVVRKEILWNGEEQSQVIYQDITERKRAAREKEKLEKQLQQAQKMEAIGTLAGGIAHDFNNVLGIILGYTELTMLNAPSGSFTYDNSREVIKACYRAKELVKQILTFSRQSEQEKKPLPVSPIVKEILKLVRSALPSTIDVHLEIKTKPYKTDIVMVDPTQIQQVLMNLSANAAHAMHPDGGSMSVELSNVEFGPTDSARPADLPPGSYLRLTVSDTGHGMEPETIARIFDPYFTTKEAGEGTGLGLAVVHGIVKSHGGTIIAHSTPREGSVFHVYLPAVASEESDEKWEPPRLRRGNETVLFVDDESSLAELGKKMLESLGYKVVPRTNGVEALETFRLEPAGFDVVITDLTMPRMTGLDLAGELLKIRPDIPIILCSGFMDTATPDKIKAIGIRKLVLKPLVMSDIARVIREVLDKK